MRLSKRRSRVLHLAMNNCTHQCRLEADLLERSSVEEDLSILVCSRLNMSQ